MGAAKSEHVVRVRRLDATEEPLLVKIQRRDTQRASLSLKLVATDQEHLYHGNIKETDLSKIRSDTSQEDPKVLQTVILSAFLHESQSECESEQGIELVASIHDATVSITIRRNISGITQKLGVIHLEQDDEREEVAAFEWVHVAAAESEQLRAQLASVQSLINDQKQQLNHLTAQLDELVASKKSHQDQLLVKFAALINAKKLKIRDQQRLLQGAKIDPAVAAEVQGARAATRSVSAVDGTNLRGDKRKAGMEEHADAREQKEDARVDDGESEGFEKRDLRDESEDGADLQQTPEQSDTDASDEDNGLDDSQAATALATSQTIAGSASDEMVIDRSEAVPPRRELPFGRRKAVQVTATLDNRNDDDVDVDVDDSGDKSDETDDEL